MYFIGDIFIEPLTAHDGSDRGVRCGLNLLNSNFCDKLLSHFLQLLILIVIRARRGLLQGFFKQKHLIQVAC